MRASFNRTCFQQSSIFAVGIRGIAFHSVLYTAGIIFSEDNFIDHLVVIRLSKQNNRDKLHQGPQLHQDRITVFLNVCLSVLSIGMNISARSLSVFTARISASIVDIGTYRFPGKPKVAANGIGPKLFVIMQCAL